MLERWQFWVLTAVALLTAAMVANNMYRFSANRQLQAEVSQRGLFIQQSVPLENLSRDIAIALAQLGVQSQDEQIRALLSSLGITVTVNQPRVETRQAAANEQQAPAPTERKGARK